MRGHNTIPRIVPSFSLFCSEIMVLARTAGGIRTWHGILAGGTIALTILLAGLTIAATPLVAQVRTTDTITTTLGADYASGGLHRWLLGSGYRDIWTTPVRVPVLDLDRTAGGLTPLRQGGGTQTRSLRFAGADGRQYVLRSIRKDPTEVLPAGLRESALSGLIEDQMSTALPVGALLVSPILEAVGVLHARPTFVVLPDDPRLGEFRDEFGGMIGLFEERPRDDDDPARSFAGAERVESTEKLRDELEEDPDIRVDAEAFLEARLLDVFLGDWDRHQDQWRWALIANGGGPKRWMPIPRDRDQAFVRFDGVALAMARQIAPQLVKFGPDYPRTVGATWNGRDVDRELLVSLERPAWRESAARLQGLLTDEVLERAVAQLPAAWAELEGATILASLKARRDKIPTMAGRYYDHLAGEVDVWATDEPELARVSTTPDGSTMVTIARRSTPEAPWFTRTFHPDETNEVRLYLRGGSDSAVVEAGAANDIVIRIIGGGSDDVHENRGRDDVRIYDDRGDNRAVGDRIETKSYDDGTVPGDPTVLPHRDWGTQRISLPVITGGPDVGLILGWHGGQVSYGFRHFPWKARVDWTAAYSTGAKTGRGTLDMRWMGENSSRFLRATLLASGVEVLRWYGLGNDTERDPARGESFFRTTQHQGRIDLAIGWQLNKHVAVQIGPEASYAVAEIDDGSNSRRFIALDAPFGVGTFGQAGLRGAMQFDTRDKPLSARRGQYLELSGVVWPELLDIDRGFGQLVGRGSTYFSAEGPGRPTLALQAGGTTTIGGGNLVPFHNLATLGSSTTLRGFEPSRFAGHHAVHASAELRLELTSFDIIVPGRQGIFGFYDGGRVWARGESSNTWHNSVGGGVWFGPLTEGAKLSVGFGRSAEGTRIHLDLGFAW